jgi:hypothetical protein
MGDWCGEIRRHRKADISRKAESKEIRCVVQWFFPRRENLIFWPAGELSLDLGPFDNGDPYLVLSCA